MATTTRKATAAAAPASTDNVLPSLDDLARLLERLRLPRIDAEALLEWQRKDLEALAEANRQAYEGIKALVERRDEILRDTLAPWKEALRDAAGKEAIARQSESAQRGVQQVIDHIRELSEMEAQARSNTWKVVQDRMQESMASLQKLLQPK
jgi:phasin family protein